jgi:hypothetical protein
MDPKLSGFTVPAWHAAQVPSPGAPLTLKPILELALIVNMHVAIMPIKKNIPVIFFITGID